MRIIALRIIKSLIDNKPECGDAREPATAWYRQVIGGRNQAA